MTQLTLGLDEYVVFDFETTGLSPWAGDEVVEIGAMRIFGREVDEKKPFQTLINPKRPISPDASRINGITNEMVKDAPTIEEVFPKFLDFIGTSWLVAQNARFDMGFFTKYLMQFKLNRRYEVFDTIAFSKRAFPSESRHNLDVIAKRLGLAIDENQRHRSIEDVRLTAHAFLNLKDRLGDNCPTPDNYTT